MSGRRHGNIPRSAPLDLRLPFPPPATRDYASVTFAAVKRILQEVESVSCARCGTTLLVCLLVYFIQ